MRYPPANSSITLWIKKACGSEQTAKYYMNRVKAFFQHFEIEPDELVAAWKQAKYKSLRAREKFTDEWTEKIEEYIYTNFDDWTTGSRMKQLAVIVSFFKHNRIPVEPEREKHVYVKYHNRDITRKEIRRILDHSSRRDKAFFLILAESGLRPQTLLQLKYKHIKRDFEANRTPMMIGLPSELLKDRVGHRWAFMGEDGFKALKEYLKPRLPLKNDDQIFQPRRKDYSTLSRSAFSMVFSNLVLKLGLVEKTENRKPKELRLYCLRKYFINSIRCDTAFREFWLGHKTTQTHYVSRDIERHREEYAKAYENLRIYRAETDESQKIEKLEKLLEERDQTIRDLRWKVQSLYKEVYGKKQKA